MKEPAIYAIREPRATKALLFAPPNIPLRTRLSPRFPPGLVGICFALLSLAGCAYNWNKPIDMSVEEAKKIILKDAQDRLVHPVTGWYEAGVSTGDSSSSKFLYPWITVTDDYIVVPYTAWSRLDFSYSSSFGGYYREQRLYTSGIGLERIYFKNLSLVTWRRSSVFLYFVDFCCCFPLLNPASSDVYYCNKLADPEIVFTPPPEPTGDGYIDHDEWPNIYRLGGTVQTSAFVFPFFLFYTVKPNDVALAYEVMIRHARQQSAAALLK